MSTGPSVTRLLRRCSRRSAVERPARCRCAGRSCSTTRLDFGELLTDEHGRLVFLPGDGQAYHAPGAKIVSFSDNNGWADNVCDGTVSAGVVQVGGRAVSAASAYVVVTPPNYGPALAEGPVARRWTRFARRWPRPGCCRATGRVRVRYPTAARAARRHAVGEQGVLRADAPGRADGLAGFRETWIGSPTRRRPARRTGSASRGCSTRNPQPAGKIQEQQPLYIGDGGVTVPGARQLAPGSPRSSTSSSRHGRAASSKPERRRRAPPASSSCLWTRNPPRSTRPDSRRCSAGPTTLASRPRGCCACRRCGSPHTVRIKKSHAMEIRDYGPGERQVAMGPTGPVHGVTPAATSRCDRGCRGTPTRRAATAAAGRRPAPSATYSPSYWPARVPNKVLTEDGYRVIVDTDAEPRRTDRRFQTRSHIDHTRRPHCRPDGPVQEVH